MFNKFKRLSAICLFVMLFSGCSGSLPTKQDSDPGTGVLAIPVSMNSNGIAHAPVWLMDFEIQDSDSNAIGEPVRLLPYEGRRYIFVPGLRAGEYEIKRARTASRRSGAVNGGIKAFQELTSGIPFKIEVGAVSVLSVIMHYERSNTDPETTITNYQFKALSEEFEEFRAELESLRNIDGWDVNWPE